jgi:branched-chain amino acid transport system substrate-binding protein
MFFEEVNASGEFPGVRFNPIGLDSAGQPEQAVNAARRLTSQDGVIAVIGPNASMQAIPVGDVLVEARVPGISTVATNPRVTIEDGQVKPYYFRVCFIDPYQGAVASGFSFDQLNARKAAILYGIGDDYSIGISEFFRADFTRRGGAIVADEAFVEADVDFRPQLTAIRDANPDVIFMPFSYMQVALATTQARELGITATFIGTDTWPSDELLTMASDAVEGSYFVNHLDFADPDVQGFREKYRTSRFNPGLGIESELNGFMAWDAATMVMEAIRATGSFNPSEMARAMSTIDFQGLTGRIEIDPQTHNPGSKHASIIRITDGEYVFETRYSPY